MKQSLLRPFGEIWILFILFALLACPGCGSVQKELSDSLGLDIRGGTVLSDRDSHGGFHGDGDRFAALHFPDQSIADELSSNKNWKSLPLSKNLTALVCGLTTETTGGVHTAGPFLTDEDGKPLFPEIKNGYYPGQTKRTWGYAR